MSEVQSEAAKELLTLNDRQRDFIATGDFLRVYGDEVRELFTILGKNEHCDLQALMGEEHGPSDKKEHFSDDQIEKGAAVLRTIGLFGELPPQSGEFSQAALLGGFTTAFMKRHALIDRGDVVIDTIVELTGQRPYNEERDGTAEELLQPGGRFGGRDISTDIWAVSLFENGRQLYETDIARLAMRRYFGSAALEAVRILPEAEVVPCTSDSEADALNEELTRTSSGRVTDYFYTVPRVVNGEDIRQKVVVLDGLAVSRNLGSSRPTTKSTVIELLERFAPPSDSEVLLVSGNPHILRTAEEVRRIFKEKGRKDIRLTAAGTIEPKGTKLGVFQTAMGEVARMIARSRPASQ